MGAENFLFLLDECDELNVLLHESLRPALLGPLLLLALAAAVGWYTASVALAAATLVATAWSGLLAAWCVERLGSNARN